MAEFSFPKKERLCGDKAIARLFKEGRSGFVYPYRYYWLEYGIREDGAGPEDNVLSKAMFSVPKKQFKRAVKRNLLKRRARDAYRLNKSIIIDAAKSKGKMLNIAFVYSSKDLSDFKTIEDGIRRILEKIGKNI